MDGVNISKAFQSRIDQSYKSAQSNNLHSAENDESSFGKLFKESLGEVNSATINADKMMSELATGKNVDIHQTMIAVEKADISFQLMLQVRNKLVAAYQEISHMQV